MECCCLSRPEKEINNDFKDLSNRNLEVKLKQENNKKSRNCWFGTLYATTSLGSGLATALTGGTSSLGTVPATVLASVATYDSFNHMYEAHQNIKTINNILKNRKEAEIVYLDNKNAITIYSENYIEKKRMRESCGNNLTENDSLNECDTLDIDIEKNTNKKKNITLELTSL